MNMMYVKEGQLDGFQQLKMMKTKMDVKTLTQTVTGL